MRSVLLVLVALSIPASGATIAAVTGNQSAFESGFSTEWSAESWTQSLSYSNVTIRVTVMPAVVPPVDYNGFAFLEEKSGNHAVEIDSTTFQFPMSEGQITLFSGLSLDPGTYYLAIYGGGFWDAEFNPTITTAPGVTVTDSLISTDNGHTFQDTNNGIWQDFRVTGDAPVTQDTPEPASSSVLAGGLLLFGIHRKRQAFRALMALLLLHGASSWVKAADGQVDPPSVFGATSIVFGEALRVNLVNLGDPSVPPGPCNVQINFVNADGAVIKSSKLEVDLGHTGGTAVTFLEASQAQNPTTAASQPVTRQVLRPVIALIPPGPCRAVMSAEVFETATGKTSLYIPSVLLPAVQSPATVPAQ